MKHCVAIIHGQPGAFGVSFPDLPGCITDGGTLDKALARAAEVVTFHLEGIALAGLSVPAPRSLDALRADPEFLDDFADAVTVALVPYNAPGRTVRVNLTFRRAFTRSNRQGRTRRWILAIRLSCRSSPCASQLATAVTRRFTRARRFTIQPPMRSDALRSFTGP